MNQENSEMNDPQISQCVKRKKGKTQKKSSVSAKILESHQEDWPRGGKFCCTSLTEE